MTYNFYLKGTNCGSAEGHTKREAMEIWAAEDLYDRHVTYGESTVVVNGVTYEC